MTRSSSSADASRDPYACLGVAPDASQAEIRKAYRRLAKETHPDRNPDDPDAAARFQAIRDAYALLSDTERRAQYDVRHHQQAPEWVTASSLDDTGCVTYYLPRVAVGLVACVAFLVLELFGVWSTRDPWHLTLWITGASAVTGLVAVVLFRIFPDASLDYAVRFRRADLTVWVDGQTVLRMPWRVVQAVSEEAPTVWTLWVNEQAVRAVGSHPPVFQVRSTPSLGTAQVHIDLGQTDVHAPSLRRFLERYGPDADRSAHTPAP